MRRRGERGLPTPSQRPPNALPTELPTPSQRPPNALPTGCASDPLYPQGVGTPPLERGTTAGECTTHPPRNQFPAANPPRRAPVEMREGLPGRPNNLARDIAAALKARGITLGDEGAVILTGAGSLRLTHRGRGITGGYWFEALGAENAP